MQERKKGRWRSHIMLQSRKQTKKRLNKPLFYQVMIRYCQMKLKIGSVLRRAIKVSRYTKTRVSEGFVVG